MVKGHPPEIDHLVVLASNLEAGAAWCERTLGVAPAPGGEHPLMGTHNRLLNVSSPAHPRAYLEIIAVHPGAESARPHGEKRWFDMDDAGLQAHVARHGPQLVHWVACVPDIAAGHAALLAGGVERGSVLAANRATPRGLLKWQITVRGDGQRLMGGCLPTLIEWGGQHPCDALPASGVVLQSLRLLHPQAQLLAEACTAIGIGQRVAVATGPAPRIEATLTTPRGPLTLTSQEPV